MASNQTLLEILDGIMKELAEKNCLPAGLDKNELKKSVVEDVFKLTKDTGPVENPKEVRSFLTTLVVGKAWYAHGMISEKGYNDTLQNFAQMIMRPEKKPTPQEQEKRVRELKLRVLNQINQLKNRPELTPQAKKALDDIEKRVNQNMQKLSPANMSKENAPISNNPAVMRLFLDSITLALIDIYNQDPRSGAYKSVVDHVVMNLTAIPKLDASDTQSAIAKDSEHKHPSPFDGIKGPKPPGTVV